MSMKKLLKNRLVKTIFGGFFALIMMVTSVASPLTQVTNVYAEPVEEVVEVGEAVEAEETAEAKETVEAEAQVIETTPSGKSCKESLEGIGWLVCPETGMISKAVDWMYNMIQQFLVINPVKAEEGQPIFEVWKYFRGITNIVFIIFLLIVIYSQITGVGITNYGIKKALPKLIVMAILVNLSFIICSLAVDVSNIFGDGLRGIFGNIEVASTAALDWSSLPGGTVSMADIFEALSGGILIGGALLAFAPGTVFMLIPVALGALVAVASGLITIALRQALVALLIMIAPLAMVANILPNTEPLFRKWKDLLTKMLMFYPMFSLLFGASHLAGFAIIASAKDGFGIILGVAVQIFPLFFSWKLMEMSGTMLGTINSKIRTLTTKPLASANAYAESRKTLTNARRLQYGDDPASHLRRFLDNRKALRENTTESLLQMRKNDANTYVQRKIAAGYNPKTAKKTDGDFTPNNYTKIAKDLSNSTLINTRTKMGTEHVISNYGDYYVDRKLRDGKKYDSERGGISKEALRIARANDKEYQRSKLGGEEFLEVYRAQMVKEHDEEADVEYASKVMLETVPENATQEQWDQYNHFILSAAGGLGENRADRVRGKIISRAAGVEAAQRRDIGYVGAKWALPKYDSRNMFVGYHHDSEGYAINRNGERIESTRGYLLEHDPSQLWWWENVDPVYGPYFDWTDENGNFITRVYKSNSSAMKELMSNFDIPINDPVNNLYTILSGIDPKNNNLTIPENLSEIGKLNMKFMGLGNLKTTLSRSLGVFKEKNAAFGPMVAEMVKEGTIKNATDLNFAYLDSLNKTTKPGNFNIQDGDAIDMDIKMLDKTEWSETFRPDELPFTENIDKKRISGTRYDGEGNLIKVSPEESTYEDLMRTIESKHATPFAVKAIVMMSRITPSTLDNQKISTLVKWKKLLDVIERDYSDAITESGYSKELEKVKRRFAARLNHSQSGNGDNSGNSGVGNDGDISNEPQNEPVIPLNELNDAGARTPQAIRNILMELDDIYNDSSNDAFMFRSKLEELLTERGLDQALEEFNMQVDVSEMNIDELYRIANSILGRYMD